MRQMVDGVTLDLTTQHVTGATALPTLCRSLSRHWNDAALAERVRLALRSSGAVLAVALMLAGRRRMYV